MYCVSWVCEQMTWHMFHVSVPTASLSQQGNLLCCLLGTACYDSEEINCLYKYIWLVCATGLLCNNIWKISSGSFQMKWVHFESSITNTIKTSKGYESILKPLGIIFLPYYRASFNKMSRVIWDCFWFVSLYFALWFVGKTCASINLNQSDFQLKLIVTWSLRCSHVILFFALIGCYY